MKSRPAAQPRASGWFGPRPVPDRWPGGNDPSGSRSAIEVYGWQVGDKLVSIKVPIDIIKLLETDIARGISMPTPCDVSGLLIGRIATTKVGSSVSVDDYELAGESDGPPFWRDQRFKDMVKRWSKRNGPRRVVGFFRSQRSGWPTIDGPDLKIAKQLRPSAQNIFLLIRTAMDSNYTGMLYLQSAKGTAVEEEYGEFPFHADVLLPRSEAPDPPVGKQDQPFVLRESPREDSAAPVAPEAPQESPKPATDAPPNWTPAGATRNEAIELFPAATASAQNSSPASSPTRAKSPGARAKTKDAAQLEEPAWFAENPPQPPTSSRYSWLSIAATWTLAVGATMWCLDGRSLFIHRRPEVRETAIAANSIGLQVDRGGELLDIVWDRTSATAMNSQGGFLTIRDGELLRQLRLDPTEIRTGHIYYQPRGADLGIRLEVAAEDGETPSESIRVLGASELARRRLDR